MPPISQLRIQLAMPATSKAKAVVNAAIRRLTPNGADILDKLEKMDHLRVQFPANPTYAAELRKLQAERDRLAEAILNS